MWAARPHLANIFEKLLDQKTFICLRLVFWTVNFCKSNVSHETNQELLLEKTIFNIRQKGVPPLLLPSSVLQLPRCLARTCNLNFHDSTLFELDSFKRCNCSRENRLQSLICFANVGYSPTPRQHFWKIAGSKNFHLPAARCLQPISKNCGHGFCPQFFCSL